MSTEARPPVEIFKNEHVLDDCIRLTRERDAAITRAEAAEAKLRAIESPMFDYSTDFKVYGAGLAPDIMVALAQRDDAIAKLRKERDELARAVRRLEAQVKKLELDLNEACRIQREQD